MDDKALASRATALAELARHLQDAREDERARLARDLHDELGSLLTSAKLDAARIRARLTVPGLAAEAVAPALERLAHLVQTLDSVIALKRRITEDLWPSALSHLGLAATADILAREFAASAGIEVHTELAPVPLSPAAELTAYRVLQEALSNIGQHARARRVQVRLAVDAGEVMLAVADDGCGFDPAGVRAAAHGLAGMRFRVEAAQGRLELDSAPGRGTRLQMRLPASG